MKTCKQCKDSKDDSEFYSQIQRDNNDKTISWRYLDSLCKKCRKLTSNDKIRKLKEKAVAYKGGKCEDCGVVDLCCIYDFHHLDPSQKEFTISKVGNKSFDKIKAELDKCAMLCAVCHRKRHYYLSRDSEISNIQTNPLV
jgi:hypothetical protein